MTKEQHNTNNLLPKYDTCFFERYAIRVLADLVDAKYNTLENRDRPDLQDSRQSIGIEVTRAMIESKNEAKALVNEVAGTRIFETDNQILGNIQTYGYGYGISQNEQGTLERDYWQYALPMQRIIESKVGKVCDGFYGNFNEFGLFIFTRGQLSNGDVFQIMNYVNTLQKNTRYHYDNLFISQADILFSCNLKRHETIQHNIDLKRRRAYYASAVKGQNHTEILKSVAEAENNQD